MANKLHETRLPYFDMNTRLSQSRIQN